MINAFVNGLCSLISIVLQLILAPVDILLNSMFPGLSEVVNAFDLGYQTIYKYADYVVNSLPVNPTLLIVLFSLVVAYTNSQVTYTMIKGAWEWFQKVKFW